MCSASRRYTGAIQNSTSIGSRGSSGSRLSAIPGGKRATSSGATTSPMPTLGRAPRARRRLGSRGLVKEEAGKLVLFDFAGRRQWPLGDGQNFTRPFIMRQARIEKGAEFGGRG